MARSSWALLLAVVFGPVCGCDGRRPTVETANRTATAGVETPPPPPPTDAPVVAPELKLNLDRGMRFPVVKTVRQSVAQRSRDNSAPLEGGSELDLFLTVTVEESSEVDGVRLRIDFERVRYSQNAAGKQFHFDSAEPAVDLPPEAVVYRSMVGNGFSIQVDPSNRLQSKIDFERFLELCLATIPSEQRGLLASRIAEVTGEENIVNFVDDSFGFLPRRLNHGSTAAVGDVWRRDRRVTRPIRLFVDETCTLVSLDDDSAEIDVTGTIAASESYAPESDSAGSAEVRVKGGHSLGHCRVDRRTGLPLETRVERLFELQVRAGEARPLKQSKRIATTIRMFPRQFDHPLAGREGSLGAGRN